MSDKIDKEVEMLLKEYDALRAEVLSHEQSQTQVTNIALLLLAGITTAASFLLSSDSSGLHLRVPLLTLIVMLLIVSLLFLSLHWTYLLHTCEIGFIASYLYQNVRPRACKLLEQDQQIAWIFDWDRFHMRKLNLSSTVAGIWIDLLYLSPYAIISIPGLIILGVAIWIYLTNFTISAVTTVGWISIILIIFNLLYFVLSMICVFYVLRVYKEIPQSDRK